MSATPLPQIIEPLKLVEQRVDLQGVIALSRLARLQDVLLESSGEIEVSLHFIKDEEGIRTITGQISAEVVMQCQRCLQPVTLTVEGDVNLGIVFSEEAAKNLPSHYEPLQLENNELELWSLVEDELILGLPIIAAHPESECSIDEHYRDAGVDAEQVDDQQTSSNPFAVLAELKKSD